MTTEWIYRADLIGAQAGGATTVFRYATQEYTTSPNHPKLPSTTFAGRLTQPLELFRDLYGQLRTHGRPEISHGTVELQNSDGGLDFLDQYAFDNQLLEVYRVDPANLDSEVLEQRLFMESLTLDESKVTVLVRDATYLLDRALQPTKYAGSNTLPNGLEGTAADIKGKPKPICYGTNYNFEPALVNTSRLIYQFHDKQWAPMDSIKVYDKHSQLAAGVSRTLTDFQNSAISATVSSIDAVGDTITTISPLPASTGDPVHIASSAALPGGLVGTQYYYIRVITSTQLSLHPTANDAANNTNKIDITDAGSGTITVAKNRTPAGLYDWCFDTTGSYVRLGAQPQGKVTMDSLPQNGVFAWDSAVGVVLDRVGSVNGFNFVVDNRVSVGSRNIGVFWNDEITAYEALVEVATNVGASFQVYPARTGPSTQINVSLQRLELPNSTTVLSLTQDNITPNSVKLLQLQDDERGIPPWRITCNYQRNRTVMSGSDVAGAAAADIAFCSSEYRTTQVEDSSLKTLYPGSPEIIVNTLLLTESDATSHAQYLQNLLRLAGSRAYSLRIPMELLDSLVTDTNLQIPGLMLAQNLNVTFPRFSLTSGKNLSLIGIALDYQARTADLTLWG